MSENGTITRMGLVQAILVIALIIGGIYALVWVGALQYGSGVSELAIRYDSISGQVKDVSSGPFTYKSKDFFDNIVRIPLNVQTIELAGVDFATQTFGVFVLSKDNLEIEFEIRFRYGVVAENAVSLWKKYPGLTYQNDAIIPAIRSVVRDVIADYNAVELQENQALIQSTISTELAEKLRTSDSFAGGIGLIGLDVTDINLPDGLLESIEAKVRAQQDFIRASFEAQRIITLANAEAQRTIIQATADAQRQIIQANATATQRVIEAFGTAQAQLTIANATAQSLDLIATTMGLNETERASLTQIYVFFQQLQLVAQANPNVTFWFFLGDPGSGTFLLLPTENP